MGLRVVVAPLCGFCAVCLCFYRVVLSWEDTHTPGGSYGSQRGLCDPPTFWRFCTQKTANASLRWCFRVFGWDESLVIEKASRNGAWMPRLCNTQAKATPHAYRARRTIPLFTQLYVARAHTLKWCVCACHHYGLVPSLRLPVLSPYVSLSRCACACCVLLLLRRTHTPVCAASRRGSAIPPPTTVCAHTGFPVCGVSVRVCVWLASNLFDNTPLATTTTPLLESTPVHDNLVIVCVGVCAAPAVLRWTICRTCRTCFVCAAVFDVCSRNSVESK